MWGSDCGCEHFGPRGGKEALSYLAAVEFSDVFRFSGLNLYLWLASRGPEAHTIPWSGSQKWKSRAESSYVEARYAQVILRISRGLWILNTPKSHLDRGVLAPGTAGLDLRSVCAGVSKWAGLRPSPAKFRRKPRPDGPECTVLGPRSRLHHLPHG